MSLNMKKNNSSSTVKVKVKVKAKILGEFKMSLRSQSLPVKDGLVL